MSKAKITKPSEEMQDEGSQVQGSESSAKETAEVETSTAVESSAGVSEQEEMEVISKSDEEPTANVPATPSQNSPAVNNGARMSFQGMLNNLAGAGFGGLKLEFGTMPVLSLDKGDFKIGDRDIKDTPFSGVPLTSKSKYCYATTGLPDKDRQTVWAESNEAHKEPTSEVAKTLAEWAEKYKDQPHVSWEIKEYLDVVFWIYQMPAATDMEGRIVMLSVAPTSVKAFTQESLHCAQRGRMPYEVLFDVSVGERIRGKVSDWQPWVFKARNSLQKLGLKVTFGEIDENF